MNKTNPDRVAVSTSIIRLSALALLLFCHACAGPPQLIRPACGTCDGDDRFVRLQISDGSLDRDIGKGFTHPFKLSREEWTRLLGNIHVRRLRQGLFSSSPEGSPVPAFDVDEVAYLAGALNKALAEARQNEWAIFGLSRTQSPEVMEITTGGWYVQGRYVHLVLANYRYAVTMPGVRERLWKEPLYTAGVFSYELVPEDFRTVTERDDRRSGVFSAEVPDLAIEYTPLLVAGPAPVSSPQTSGDAKGRSITQDLKTVPTVSVEERLRTLKRLKEQALITEEEYREKRKQVLDQF